MNKQDLIEAVIEAVKENSTATVFFHIAMADATGLCPSDHKALDIISRHEGLTAGELGQETGLASASVTSLLDRLEARGYVRRVRGRKDRRRIKVQAIPEQIEELQEQFSPLKEEARERLKGLNAEQLETIRDFLRTSSKLLREEVIRLSNEDPEKVISGCG